MSATNEDILEALKEIVKELRDEKREKREEREKKAAEKKKKEEEKERPVSVFEKKAQQLGSMQGATMEVIDKTIGALINRTIGAANDRYDFVKGGATDYVSRIAADYARGGQPLADERILQLGKDVQDILRVEFKEMERVERLMQYEPSMILRATELDDESRELREKLREVGEMGIPDMGINLDEITRQSMENLMPGGIMTWIAQFKKMVDLYQKMNQATNNFTENLYFNSDDGVK